MARIIVTLFCCCLSILLQAQVGIGTAVPNANAALDVNSSSKGLLPPRMSSSNRLAIVNPAEGLVLYDNTIGALFVYADGRWVQLGDASQIANQLPFRYIGVSSQSGDLLGSSVCLGADGSTGMVGVPVGNAGEGKVFTVRKSANNMWATGSTLSPADLAVGDNFGYAVAMDRLNGSRDAVVGSPFDDSSTVADMGSVYFYSNSSVPSLVNKVYAPLGDRVANARFGRSVDIAAETGSGNPNKGIALIGAPGANGGKGAAYVYTYNAATSFWDYSSTLTDSQGASGDSLGTAVSLYYSITGDTAWAFVGAPFDDENIADAGSVSVFRKAASSTLWSQVAKISPTASLSSAMFGYSLANAMKCKWFAIGALASGTSNGGRSYVANLTNLSGGLASFSTASVESNGQTGKSMSMMPEGTGCSSIYLLCGARNGVIGPSTADNYGRADLIYFDGATWSSLLSPITDPEANAENYGFGEAVSIHTANRTMMIAAPRQPLLSTTNVGKVEFRKY